MRIPTIIALAAAVGLAASGVQAATSAHSPKPLVSLAKARAMALKLAPGRIISSEYEKAASGAIPSTSSSAGMCRKSASTAGPARSSRTNPKARSITTDHAGFELIP